MRTAIISGTFDPVTVGHMSLIERASKLFGNVVIAVSASHYKSGFLPAEQRVEALKASVELYGNVTVELSDGLLADFCSKYESPVIVRGARNGNDFEYEADMYAINKGLSGVESIILPSESGMAHISSSFARELIKYGRPLDGVVPDGAIRVIEKYIGNKQ